MIYNINFEKLCEKYQLGQIKGNPIQLFGGLLHRMYEMNTTKGRYAVKALNPQIMNRPFVMDNIINSEIIAEIAGRVVPTISSNVYNKERVLEVDQQFYLVFDWIDGKSLKDNELDIHHVKKIAFNLARIHSINFSQLEMSNAHHERRIIDWNHYLHQGKEKNLEWVDCLQNNINDLAHWNEEANEAEKELSLNMVISHRDLDPKNVLWIKDNPVIIDWESAGYINPLKDLVETALYWSKDKEGNFDKERFLSFVQVYKKERDISCTDWKMVLMSGYTAKLDWLEYSLKRSLWIECASEKEQVMGTEQAIEQLTDIIKYKELLPTLTQLLI